MAEKGEGDDCVEIPIPGLDGRDFIVDLKSQLLSLRSRVEVQTLVSAFDLIFFFPIFIV